jgi:hypothetical protein
VKQNELNSVAGSFEYGQEPSSSLKGKNFMAGSVTVNFHGRPCTIKLASVKGSG